ncbi:MAG: hypothetical protein K6E87_04590 [bacterium]|nr:hypothetical protein [bacterium]
MTEYLRTLFIIILSIPKIITDFVIPWLFTTPLDNSINILGVISFPNPFGGMPPIYCLSFAGFMIILFTKLRHFLLI